MKYILLSACLYSIRSKFRVQLYNKHDHHGYDRILDLCFNIQYNVKTFVEINYCLTLSESNKNNTQVSLLKQDCHAQPQRPLAAICIWLLRHEFNQSYA